MASNFLFLCMECLLRQPWNVENTATGEAASFNSEKLMDLTKVAEKRAVESNTTAVEETFLVVLPRWRHKEDRCLAAKEKELQSWDEF